MSGVMIDAPDAPDPYYGSATAFSGAKLAHPYRIVQSRPTGTARSASLGDGIS
jgi:hypothetical protein